MGYNKVTLRSGQTCDYLYVTKNQTIPNVTDAKVSDEPSWNGTAALLSLFNDNKLIGGDPNLESSLVGCEIRRKKGTDPFTEYVATIDSTQNGYIIDYATTNNSYYTYYLYPKIKDSETQEIKMLKPLTTRQIKTNWNYWCLMTVDETEDENVFYLSNMFFFRFNVEEGAMNNNADISISKNFTRYPFVQYGYSNYWSSNLSGLVGGLSCPKGVYYQTTDMINDLKALTTDGKRKFLKDISGNIYEVSITDSITIEPYGLRDIKKKTISWAEVGDAKGVSIISNPNNNTDAWVLTENGVPKPYVNYSWIETGLWEADKYWTENKK